MATKQRGLTLIELLSVLTIVAVLAALLYPVFKSVRMRALDAQCISKLRAFGEAYAIYRHEYGGDGIYGYPWEMGLPPNSRALNMPREAHYCPLGAHAHNTFVPDPGADELAEFGVWRQYVLKFREDAILRADLNHNSWGRAISSPYMRQKGIGLYLGGYVKVVVRQGDPASIPFWHENYYQ